MTLVTQKSVSIAVFVKYKSYQNVAQKRLIEKLNLFEIAVFPLSEFIYFFNFKMRYFILWLMETQLLLKFDTV